MRSAAAGGSRLCLHVRSDELHVIAGALAGHPRLRLEGCDSAALGAARGTTAGLAGERLTPLSILSAAERKLLTLAQIASFSPARFDQQSIRGGCRAAGVFPKTHS